MVDICGFPVTSLVLTNGFIFAIDLQKNLSAQYKAGPSRDLWSGPAGETSHNQEVNTEARERFWHMRLETE